MISSGALPKVALSSPPMASPVREAMCSVASTMSVAIGIIATHALKKIQVCASGATCSSMMTTGMKMRSQLIVMGMTSTAPFFFLNGLNLLNGLNYLNLILWLPAAAQRPVKLHDGSQLRAPRACKQQFLFE